MYYHWSKSHSLLLFAVLFLLLLAACGSEAEPTPVPTETAVPEQIAEATDVPTDVPTEEPTAVPTETAIPPTATETPSPVPTDTPEPTHTATPTDVPTETPLPTDTPTATAVPPTTVPPTAVPPTAAPIAAPTFPETQILPFDADTFARYLGLVRDSYRSFNSEMSLFAETGKPGDCGTFNGWTQLWIIEARGFTDVPANWQPLYAEYRSMLSQIVRITMEIRPLCSGQGGQVSAETTQAIVTFLTWAYPRSEAMVAEAATLPRP